MRSRGKKGTSTSRDDDAVVRVGHVGARETRIDERPTAPTEKDPPEKPAQAF
jgi:hypothetical protein